MNTPLGLKALLLASPLLMSTAFANEQPLAEDLVGKFYGGAHLIYVDNDNDRSKPNDPYSTVSHGSGFGGELGYRFNESGEARLSYSKINIDKNNSFFDNPYVAAIDGLYFPTKENVYLLAGLGYLDVGQTKPSLGIGAGYRHYFSENTAIYIEGKAQRQFSGSYNDTNARLGVLYFFGGSTPSLPTRIKETVVAAVAPVVAALDADNDGVVDENDHCANTPLGDKVDQNGCTIFSTEKRRMTLLVNFDNDKSVVKVKYLPEIKRMADFLTTYPNVTLVIEGHTSSVGTIKYNKKISQDRANAIVDVLVDNFNIERSRLTPIGHGEDRLLDLGTDKAAHAKNRRIEAEVEVSKKVAVDR